MSTGDAWTSGRRAVKYSQVWVWQNNGKQIDYRNWLPGQPSSDDFIGIQKLTGGWVALPEDRKIGALCEQKPCARGWTYFEKTQKCYKAKESYASWTAALSVCEGYPQSTSTLAVIPDAHTNDFLTKLTDQPVWIGGWFKSSWLWYPGEKMEYTNWSSGAGSATDGAEYIAFNIGGVGKWKNEKNRMKSFICQYDISDTRT